MTEQWDFDTLWPIQAEPIDSINRRGAGWSSVSCIQLGEKPAQPFYLKRQQNYFSRHWRHPWRGQLTLINEHRILQHLAQQGVGTPTIASFAVRNEPQARAILMTHALIGYQDLTHYLAGAMPLAPSARYALIRAVAHSVRAMHAAGVQSRSLYPKHIFIQQTESAGWQVALIDFEKSRRLPLLSCALLPEWLRLCWVLRDIISLNNRSPQATNKDRILFFKAYLHTAKLTRLQRGWMRWIAGRGRQARSQTNSASAG